MSKNYFGTDGIRGKFGVELTSDLVNRVGLAAGHVFKSGSTVCIGMDPRVSSSEILDILTKALNASGVNVEQLGVVSTPVVSHNILNSNNSYVAGIMISASHNPYFDNGIKFFGPDGKKINDAVELEIESYIDANIKPQGSGNTIVNLDAVNNYVEYLVSLGCNLEGLKIGLDCANGSAYEIAPQIFTKLGAELVVIGNEPDGININDNIGSTHPKALSKLGEENKFDFGFCYDGDADRIILVDGMGSVLDGDYIIYLITKYLKQNNELNNNLCVGTVMANLGFKSALKDLDVKYIETAVGDRYVIRGIDENDASIGGEQSGHIILPHLLPTGDGILTSVILARMFCENREQLKTLKSELVKYPQELVNIRVADKKLVMENEDVLALVSAQSEILGERGRILVRESGTESLVRVMAEAESEELCNEIMQPIINKILEYKI